MMENILKPVNSVNIAKYCSNKFLSDSVWSSLSSDNLCRKYCLMTSLLMWCLSHLGAASSMYSSKLPTSTCTLLFQNVSSNCVVVHQIVQVCTRKEYENTKNSWQLPHIPILIYNFHKLWISTRLLNISQSQRSHPKMTSQIRTGLALQLGLSKVML